MRYIVKRSCLWSRILPKCDVITRQRPMSTVVSFTLFAEASFFRFTGWFHIHLLYSSKLSLQQAGIQYPLSGARYEVDERQGTMRLVQPRPGDEGKYRCEASNQFGKATATASIQKVIGAQPLNLILSFQISVIFHI